MVFSFLRLPKWPVKMIATAKRSNKSPILRKLNRIIFISGHRKQSVVTEILSAQALKDMLVTVCPLAN
jgi:hypothetical protein